MSDSGKQSDQSPTYSSLLPKEICEKMDLLVRDYTVKSFLPTREVDKVWESYQQRASQYSKYMDPLVREFKSVDYKDPLTKEIYTCFEVVAEDGFFTFVGAKKAPQTYYGKLTKYFAELNEVEWQAVGKFYVEDLSKQPVMDGVVQVTHFELDAATRKSRPTMEMYYSYLRGMYLPSHLMVKTSASPNTKLVTYQYVDESGSQQSQTWSFCNDFDNNRTVLVRREGDVLSNISINRKTVAFPAQTVQFWHTDLLGNLLTSHKEGFIDEEGNYGEKQNGRGVMISVTDGTKYEGEIPQQFQYHGKGVLTSREPQSLLEGVFEEGYIRHGTLETEEFSYTGDFQNGVQSGKGCITYKNSDKYEGDFVNSRMEGFGKYTYANGDYYEGSFSGNHFHGQGKYVFANGAFMEGLYEANDLVNGKMQIPASAFEISKDIAASFAQGPAGILGALMRVPIILWLKFKNLFTKEPVMVDEYEGALNSEREYTGQGKHRDLFGNIYEGHFINGEKSGKGRYLFSGKEYIGEFKNNNLHGQGKLIMKNGDYYIGEFKEGDYDGYGKLVAKGTVKKGIWREGKLVEDHSNDDDQDSGLQTPKPSAQKNDPASSDPRQKFSPVRLSLRAAVFAAHLPQRFAGSIAATRRLLNERAMDRIVAFRTSHALATPRTALSLRLLRRLRLF